MKIKCPKCENLFEINEKTEDFDLIPEFSTKKLFVNSEIGLRMRSTSEIKKDNIITTIPFGAEVVVIEENDKWFKIRYDEKEGWSSCYYLIEGRPIKQSSELSKKESMENILPVFKLYSSNLADDSNAIKLRKIIKDQFGGGAHNWDLQCTEYVHYKIQLLGITIDWPNERPRHGGRWATIFETSGQYKVLNQPKAGCAMSFTSGLKNSNVGHVAFVEDVYKNESIKISEANWPPPGKYCERILTKAQWRDKYKGRFIDFT